MTALAKLLTLTVMLGSITACSNTPYQSQSVRQPAVKGTVTPSEILNVVQLAYINNRYGLNKIQKEKQTAAIFTALESQYGKEIFWYERDARGVVKAVHGYPMGAGFCRVVMSYIEVKGRGREFTETACKSVEYDGWRFQRKR